MAVMMAMIQAAAKGAVRQVVPSGVRSAGRGGASAIPPTTMTPTMLPASAHRRSNVEVSAAAA